MDLAPKGLSKTFTDIDLIDKINQTDKMYIVKKNETKTILNKIMLKSKRLYLNKSSYICRS